MTDEGKAVLITGAAGGIGGAAARELARRGYRVYAGVRGATPVPGAVPVPGAAPVPGITTVQLDVTDTASIASAVREIAGRERGLHALINNAGVIVQGPLELVPEAEMLRAFAVNVHGPALVTRAFLPLLREGGGRVINISAPTARVAIPHLGVLAGSKAALESQSAAARVELRKWRIPVVVIEPGAADTEIFAKSAAAAKSALADADPALVALYQPQLDAIAAASAKQRLAPLTGVTSVIIRAVTARRPRPFYTAGRDARLAGVLAALPPRTRDRVLARALGLLSG
jgi:NAD(P)-dependent dehydrogenase (short-subunit alcohol dehydrogenase family)